MAVVTFCFRLMLFMVVAVFLISESGMSFAQKPKRTSSKLQPTSGGKRRNNATAPKTTVAPAAAGSSTVSYVTKIRRGQFNHFRPAGRPPAALVKRVEEFCDEASRTVAAEVVFEGRPVRLLPLSLSGSANPGIGVEFDVMQVFKGDVEYTQDELTLPSVTESLSGRSVIVGPFPQAKSAARPPSCNEIEAPVVSVSADEEQQLYIVFAKRELINRWSNNSADNVNKDASVDHYYRLTGKLVNATIQTIKDVQQHACGNCSRPPDGVLVQPAPKQQSIIAGRKFQLECRTRHGSPAPRYSWLKDGVELPTIVSHTKRGSSKLTITKVSAEDAGTYTCRATNVLGSAESRSVKLTVNSLSTTSTTPLINEQPTKTHSERCAQQTYCLNGGTCYVLVNLRAEYCECSQSFSGRRCDERLLPSAVRTKTVTESSDSELFPLPDFYFMIIILPAVGFTALLGTVILICCLIKRGSCKSQSSSQTIITDGSPERDVTENELRGGATRKGDAGQRLSSHGRRVNSYVIDGDKERSQRGDVADFKIEDPGPSSQGTVLGRNPSFQQRRNYQMESGGSRPDDDEQLPILSSYAADVSAAAPNKLSNSQPEAAIAGENGANNRNLRTTGFVSGEPRQSATSFSAAQLSPHALNAQEGLYRQPVIPQYRTRTLLSGEPLQCLPGSLADDSNESQRTRPGIVSTAPGDAKVPDVELRPLLAASAASKNNSSQLRSSYPYDSDPEATVI